MSEQAEGWHTDASGLRVKKWDPHRETRRRGYERQLQQHQARRLDGAPPSSYASNQPGTLAARGAAARAKAQQSRDARVGRAKKFNDRHAEALVRRQKQGILKKAMPFASLSAATGWGRTESSLNSDPPEVRRPKPNLT